MKRKYNWWQCQKCGEYIGLIGRIINSFILLHKCEYKKGI